MSVLNLVEYCPTELAHSNGAVVALTPDAMYLCQAAGIEHRRIDALYSESELRVYETRYWEEQIAWFELFDDLLLEHLPELRSTGLRPALLWGFRLKFALDNVFIRGFELASALERLEGISRVVLWSRDSRAPGGGSERNGFEGPSDAFVGPNVSFHGASVHSRLLPLLCARAGLDYEERGSSFAEEPRQLAKSRTGFRQPVGDMRRRLSPLRARWSAALAPRGESGPLTFLFLHDAYDLAPLRNAALGAGHRCLISDGTGIFDISRRVPRAVTRLRPRPEPGPGLRAAAQSLTAPGSPLWGWPDSWFDAPVSPLLAPRMEYFILEVVPTIASQSEQLRKLCDREKVDYVVAPILARTDHFAGVHAAQSSLATQSVSLDHGDGAFDEPVLDLLNRFQFDHFFTPSRERAEYYARRSKLYRHRLADIHVGSYRWESYRRLARRHRFRYPPPAARGSLPVVVYAVASMAGDYRYLNNPSYADTWYYELQTRIVDALAVDGRFTFVVKLFPGKDVWTGPIRRYVADKAAPHLQLSRKPLTHWLSWADRVILDYPSTGLYETALAGVPLLCLLHRGLAIRKEAVQEIAEFTASFTSADEAVEAIGAFLDTPQLARPRLRREGKDILKTLEELASARAVGRTDSPPVH